MPENGNKYIHLLRCPDVKGIVAGVSGYLSNADASIVESNHYHDASTGTFFMRTVFQDQGRQMGSAEAWRNGFEAIAKQFSMDWELHDASVKPRVVIAVSKFGHCLQDLLHRWKSGLLNIEIPAVISNHDDMRSFVQWNNIPYYHLPVTKDAKEVQEARIKSVVTEHKADLVVLARYMQILSPDLCSFLSGRCINIHHSFLPSFKGAKPYHQARARGVKMIGATAHYVTTDLDEGPIIEQDALKVSHVQSADQLVEVGRDVECSVLARAVRWHTEHRIIMNGNQTVVFAA